MKEVNAVGRTQGQAPGRTLMLLALTLLAACDPGMTVRQINSVVESENAAATAIPKISVEVKTTHQLIGESWYSPQITATNSFDVPVTITSVELIAGSTTFQNSPRAAKDYPVNLPARSTVPLHVDFGFNDGMYVEKVFRNPGELRIHYSSQQGAGLARITVARGHLNAK
jgi:hypothetical protein